MYVDVKFYTYVYPYIDTYTYYLNIYMCCIIAWILLYTFMCINSGEYIFVLYSDWRNKANKILEEIQKDLGLDLNKEEAPRYYNAEFSESQHMSTYMTVVSKTS